MKCEIIPPHESHKQFLLFSTRESWGIGSLGISSHFFTEKGIIIEKKADLLPKTVVLNIWGLLSLTFAWAAAADGRSLCSETRS